MAHPVMQSPQPSVAPHAGRPLPHVDGVRHRYVDTSRLRVHLAEAGEGEPLLLLHGWPQHWYAWRKVIPLLAVGHHLICVDQRGAGWSEAPTQGYRTGDLADDLVALLDTLRLDRVSVIGQDVGGRVGFELALRAPSRVRRLVTLGSMHPYWNVRALGLRSAWRQCWTPLVETPYVGRWVVRHVPALMRALLRVGVRDRSAVPTDVVEEYVASARQPANARASEALMHAFAYHEIIPNLLGRQRSRRLTVPTLMLNGARDALLPVSGLAGYEPYTDALRVQVVPGVGHLLSEECPQLVAAASQAFLHETPPVR